MSVIHSETAKVKEVGASFDEYGGSLLTTLEEINNEVETITSRGMEGESIASLLTTYEDIHTTIKGFAQKIQALGLALQENASAKESIDAEAAAAAGGSGV